MPLPYCVALLAWPALLAATGMAAHAATPCALASTGPAQVMAAGGQPVALPAALADCEGLRVLRGPVVACVQDRRDRLACRTLGEGTIQARHLPIPGAGRNWLDIVLSLLRGDGDAVTAVSRQGVLTGLPVGTVAFLGAMPEVQPGVGALTAIDRIDFRDASSGEAVITLTRGSAGVLPRELFRPGRAYVWTVRSRDLTFDERSQRFRVLTANESAEVLAEVEQASAEKGPDPAARAVSTAAALSRRGLQFDARQTLARNGFAVR
jgi:hypothetical protein